MLAINTAFATASLALELADGRKFFKSLSAEAKHSENVLKAIDEMCQEAQIDVLDVGTIAVVTGPGSFTGLRIGVAIAKALGCVNKNLKFISISSLQLMAYIKCQTYKKKENFACVLNALSNLYFVAYFDKDGAILEEEKLIGEDEYLRLQCPKYALAGDLPNLPTVEITCQNLLSYAKLKEAQKEFVSCQELLPKYIRLSQAEDNMLKKQKKD